MPAPLERLVLQLLAKHPRTASATPTTSPRSSSTSRSARRSRRGRQRKRRRKRRLRGAHGAGYLYRPRAGRARRSARCARAGDRARRRRRRLVHGDRRRERRRQDLPRRRGGTARAAPEAACIAGDALAIAPTDGRGDGRDAGGPFTVHRLPVPSAVADGKGRSVPRSARRVGVRSAPGERAAILAPYEPSLAVLVVKTGARTSPRSPVRPRAGARSTRSWRCWPVRARAAAVPDPRRPAVGWMICRWHCRGAAGLAGSPDKPILLIATCRAEEMTDEVRALVARPDVRSLRLPMPEVRSGDLAGRGHARHEGSAAGAGELSRQTEGNPFFVAEYLRAAVGENHLYRDARFHWRVAPSRGQGSGAPSNLWRCPACRRS